MLTVGAYQAKTNFSELIERVQKGERITITRFGEPLAILIPVESEPSSPLDEIIRDIKSLRAQNSLGNLNLKEVIEERRW